MKKTIYRLGLFSCLMLLSLIGYSQNTVSGKILDGRNGEEIIGATIIVVGTSTGTITDYDGTFTLTTDQEFPFEINITYTGYETTRMTITESGDLGEISFRETTSVLDEVVITASRRKEKVQDAPASVSILNARQLSTTPQTDATRTLLNVPGVQIQQQSASRSNIEMRGGSSVFDTRVLPLKDYRALSSPGVNTYDGSSAGSTIDLKKIEVVRGAGSALYGPGVSTGVVHFLTKSAIDDPGTAVELMGGELNTFGGSVRHAMRFADGKVGVKVNFTHRQGDEWTLDGSEGTTDASGVFTSQLSKFKKQVVRPYVTESGFIDGSREGIVLLDSMDLDPDGDGNLMRADYVSTLGDLTVELRPTEDLSVTLHGGLLNSEGVFYNDQGEGLSQTLEYWTQARAQYKGFFGQFYYVNNNGGTDEKPTFLYQTGNIAPAARQQLEGQLQYNFGVENFLDSDFTVGVDYRNTILESQNLVYGRYEDDDDYTILGAYLQGKFALLDKLDLVLAGRFDTFNFFDDGELSPRAALVYKIDPKHTVRASYNKSVIPPSALNMFIDFPVNVPAPGIADFWLIGQKDAQTFSDNPMIDVSVPGVPDLPYGTPGMPLAIPYGAVAPDTWELICQSPLIPADIKLLLQQFAANYAPGGVTGDLVGLNLFDGSPINELTPTIPAVVSTATTYELGYSGLIADRLKVSVDIYNIHNRGSSDFTQVGPVMSLQNPNLAEDLETTIDTDLTEFFIENDVDPAVADFFAATIADGFFQAGLVADSLLSPLYPIFGAVESEQAPDDGLMHIATGYRIFDSSYDYWGADIGMTFYVNDEISVFANYSWVSDEVFETKQSEDSDVTFDTYLGAPANKFRIGANYNPSEFGFRGQISYQHDDAFESNFGNYSGTAEAKDLIDASVGYKFPFGLSIDLSGTNILNNKFRALPNMPQIGRRVLGKLTYEF